MATSINHLKHTNSTVSPITPPIMPNNKPVNDLDITKHIQDVKGITNMHIHTIGHNNNAIEFVGSKDHTDNTQWPITDEMSKLISDNNNLNKKYLPIVIPYNAACYVCNENKHKKIKRVSIITLIIIVCIAIIVLIAAVVNKNKISTHIIKKENIMKKENVIKKENAIKENIIK